MHFYCLHIPPKDSILLLSEYAKALIREDMERLKIKAQKIKNLKGKP